MLRINDDSDELFRNAAEHYPLHIGEGDWESVRKKLSEWTDEEPVAPAKKINKRFGFFLLSCIGLLMLAPVAVFDLVSNLQPANSSVQASTVSYQTANRSLNDPINLPGLISPAESDHRNSSVTSIHLINNPREKTFKSGQRFNPGPLTEALVDSSNKEPFPTPDQPGIVNKISGSTAAGNLNNARHETTHEEIIPGKIESSVDDKLSKSKKETLDDIAGGNKKTRNGIHGFYAGLIGGADISMIKMQSVKKIGFSVGVLAGYRLNKKISFETGLVWDNKNYNTDGKYFNPKNIYLPTYSTILYASGDCNMFELPVNVRYNFRVKQKSKFFATAGSSSYFMKKESYDYTIKHYNSVYNKYYDYKNSGSSLFAVVNLSAGLERNLGQKSQLRVEPYIKIPVRKVGIGNMPLQSTGINLGITRSF